MTANTTGPASKTHPIELLRRIDPGAWADVRDPSGWTYSTNIGVIAQTCRAAWEADLAKIALYEGRHPAQLTPDGREMSPRHRFNGDGICIRCGSDVESDTGCVEELRAALDRARALLTDSHAYLTGKQSVSNPVRLVADITNFLQAAALRQAVTALDDPIGDQLYEHADKPAPVSRQAK